MEDFRHLLQGIYKMMLDIQVPVFGQVFSLWTIFLFGALGALVVWFILRFLK